MAVTSPNAIHSIHLASFDQHRDLLFSIAYRMLGSVADAEDMVQEAFIRWHQSRDEEIRSPRAFLVAVVSRLCINQLQSARVQREQYVGEWLPEPIVTDSVSDPFGSVRRSESLSFAFLILLERLTPAERAVYLLREVFEYEYAEIASILEQSEANCRQIFRRARQHVGVMQTRFAASQVEQSNLLQQFLGATRTGELDGLVDLLAKDVMLHSDGGGKAIAVPNQIKGATNVARGILGSLKKLVPKTLVRRLLLVNGKPGLVNYLNGKAHSVLSIDVAQGRIRAIYILTNPDKLSHLPDL